MKAGQEKDRERKSEKEGATKQTVLLTKMPSDQKNPQFIYSSRWVKGLLECGGVIHYKHKQLHDHVLIGRASR